MKYQYVAAVKHQPSLDTQQWGRKGVWDGAAEVPPEWQHCLQWLSRKVDDES
eukprot:m.112132 g.112132  ORF g.112132 m.112132 type:complete len:52 (-) comp17031_c1_seq3:9-164(-)